MALRRRDFLTAGLALFGGCHMSTAAPEQDPPLNGLNGQSPHFDYRIYRAGNYRITLSLPRVAYSSSVTQTHYAGLNRNPVTGLITLRVNTAADAIGTDGEIHCVSSNDGRSFGSAYVVQGSHTSAEPLTWVSSASRFEGGVFAPADFTFPGGDRTKASCPKKQLSADGLSYTTIGTCTFNGFPSNIGDYGAYPGVSWFGTIIQIASNNWITTILPTYQGNTRCDWELFKSTDGGTTWNYLSSPPKGPNEGCDEATIVKLTDGRIFGISRVGATPNRAAISSDNGATWGALYQVSCSGLAPFAQQLTATDDVIVTTGSFSTASVWPAGPDPVTWTVPEGYVPFMMGLHVTSDVTAAGWPGVDLITHHNLMVASEYRIGTGYPRGTDGLIPSGYTSSVPLSSAAGVSHVLISYDRCGAAGVANQVFVVDAAIERLS